ncbi:hypothetical protein ACSS6W_005574 [Trichoderma asperelloides]
MLFPPSPTTDGTHAKVARCFDAGSVQSVVVGRSKLSPAGLAAQSMSIVYALSDQHYRYHPVQHNLMQKTLFNANLAVHYDI